MEKYKVKINPKAIRELDNIYEYIANTKLDPENAEGQINRIKKAILNLVTFPQSPQERNEGRYASNDTPIVSLPRTMRILTGWSSRVASQEYWHLRIIWGVFLLHVTPGQRVTCNVFYNKQRALPFYKKSEIIVTNQP